jgi:hypothetical protein
MKRLNNHYGTFDNLKVYVDIDETICFYDDERKYSDAIPMYSNIEKINNLFDMGHQITYYTARGSVSKIDYYDLTRSQLEKWGCKFHYLSVGEKPHYDLLVCDKTKRIEEL